MRLSILLLAPLLFGEHVVGPVRYSKKGVELGGKTIAWKDVSSLEETDADAKAEYAGRKADDTAVAQFELGRWCRERGLEEEAAKHFARALELDAKHEPSLCALGRASDVVDAKRKSLPTLEFADWCRERALVKEEWDALVAALVKDAWNRDAIRRAKPRTESRVGPTLLRPPFEGRWKGLVDTTGHHQIKVFAIHAIDFVKVDANGKIHSGSGKALADYFGYDQPVYAAADGDVLQADDKFADLPPGKSGKFDEANFVTIKHSETEYTAYGHVRKGSVAVKVGDRVKKGDRIARVGNSGASGLPHLHFTMQTPVYSGASGGWIGIPYRFGGFKLVHANGTACSVDVKAARPQEGWTMECPAPK